jgi:hypothetical protein
VRIFVSSSFEDLKEHRAAVIRVLRQLGHEVLAMDLTAASAAPLSKVLDMVDRSEAYVGVFAWRYGYVPGQGATVPPGQVPQVTGAILGETSITHYEYLRALERNLPIMAFLLDEQYPWPPQLIDGFDSTHPQAPVDASKIRALRQQLQLERVVSRFTTPSDLEARVSAAVTMGGLTRQMNLKAGRPIVYISYRWVDAADQGRPARAPDPRARELADKLREQGVDVRLDIYFLHNMHGFKPPERVAGDPRDPWLVWAERQIVEADGVLMLCTPEYTDTDPNHGVLRQKSGWL